MPSASPQPRKRSIVYVDGYNLYYGAVKGGPHKWLNLERYLSLLRPNDDLQVIRYFTAIIEGPDKGNQLTFLRALGTCPLVETVLGKFKAKRLKCKVEACSFSGSRLFTTQEEKRTDVNIAIHMLHDAYQNSCDRLILVSGDSDLVPAVNHVKQSFPEKEIIVYVPARDQTRGAAVELRSAADKDRLLPLQMLPHSQFPVRIPDGSGGFILKPPGW